MNLKNNIFYYCIIILFVNISTSVCVLYRELYKDATKSKCSFSATILLRYYKIDCPKTNSKLKIVIGPGSRTDIKCYDNINYQEFKEILPNMTIGIINTVQIKDCPLPELLPIASIIQQLGIKSYKTLVISSNNDFFTPISQYHFSDLYTLRNLTLKMERVTYIPQNLFMDKSLKNLTSLGFYSNVQQLPNNIFMNLENVDFISLGTNLQLLSYDIFHYQTKLIELNLSGNKLKNITNDLFQFSPTLKSINLENNYIEILPANIFESLYNLIIINLNGNRFSSLPEGLLKNNKKLNSFFLAHNQVPLTTLPSKLLADLSRLLEVTLQCNLVSVPEDVFQNSIHIETVIMSHNNLQELPELIFESQANLKYLDLSHNNLNYLPEKLLTNTTVLQELDASRNRLRNLTSLLFERCHMLQVLNLNDNELTTENIHITYYLRFHRNLKILSLKNNSINYIFKDWTMPYFLEKLDMSYNNITVLNDDDVVNLIVNNLQLYLTNNNIKTINLQTSSNSKEFESNQLLKIDINDNPINCDCNLLSFVKYFKGENESYPLMDHIQFSTKNLMCSQPKEFQGKLIKYLDPKTLLCNYYDNCPKSCNCWIRSYDKILIVNCSNLQLKTVPQLPVIEEINMKGIELNLENNQLLQLPTYQTRGYANVTKLLAANNKLINIERSQMPVNLTYIDIRGNQLKTLNITTLMFMNESKCLQEVYLSNNSWICDCDARPLLRFTQSNIQLFKDFSNMTCANTEELTYFFDLQDLCPVEKKLYIILGLLSAIICLTLALYYKYQTEIKIWLYAHNMCLCCVTERELDKDKKYDAFISYSHKDEDFVIDCLVPELENGRPSFKLCVHFRDWLVGECIPDQIMQSVANSRKTIVLLSKSFIESVWAKIEFKAAHQAALTEGRAKVIVIIYDDIGDIENLDGDLKAYLKMNTYLKWGDPWFWKKLRYAMPHKRNYDNNFDNISLNEMTNK